MVVRAELQGRCRQFCRQCCLAEKAERSRMHLARSLARMKASSVVHAGEGYTIVCCRGKLTGER